MRCARENCPALCLTKVFRPSVMSTLLPQPKYTSDDVIVTVYYRDFKYKEYTETQAIDLANFVANLGGIVGGWTGMSFITYAQLLILIPVIIWRRIRRRWKAATPARRAAAVVLPMDAINVEEQQGSTSSAPLTQPVANHRRRSMRKRKV
jgi:Amiloride-sensitive sodium channel